LRLQETSVSADSGVVRIADVSSHRRDGSRIDIDLSKMPDDMMLLRDLDTVKRRLEVGAPNGAAADPFESRGPMTPGVQGR
jgi:hypothetical protein